jgi:CheY-like chemotaxis protein
VRPDSVPDEGTVLVVDDNPAAAGVTSRMLEDGGYWVRWASSVSEALAMLTRNASIRLVLTDVLAPSLKGIDLAMVVRRLWPELPVVVMTASWLPENGHSFSLVDIPILEKPFDEASLLGLVRASVENYSLEVSPSR